MKLEKNFFKKRNSMNLRVKGRFSSETEGRKSGYRFRGRREGSVGEEEFSLPFEVLPAGLRIKLT